MSNAASNRHKARALVCSAFALWVGCASQIGDSCQDNVECSPRGDRICDTAQVDGYCTVQGCSARTCPDDAVCVGFYPISFLTIPCDPRLEDAPDGDGAGVEARDDCLPEEICLTGGLCAQEAQEQRFCMKPCEKDGDCRKEYECAEAGTAGAEGVPDPDGDDEVPRHRFCRQRSLR